MLLLFVIIDFMFIIYCGGFKLVDCKFKYLLKFFYYIFKSYNLFIYLN